MNAENAILSKLWSKDLQRFVSSYTDKNGNYLFMTTHILFFVN